MARMFVVSAKEITQGKQKFIVCNTNVYGTWYKFKFTKECEKQPKKQGLYDISVESDNMSVQRGKPFTTKNGQVKEGNDIIWVRAIKSIRQYTEEELAQRNRDKLNEIFGEEEE